VGRRLLILLVVLVVVGAPAAALRASCAGASCRSTSASGPAPFCSLPADLRALITAGTYEGRSPDVMGVTANAQVTSRVSPGLAVPWPATTAPPGALTAPLVFLGRNVRAGTWSNAGLDQIAPTVAKAIGLHRAHPEVRHGIALDNVVRPGTKAPLVVVIVWKGVGTSDVAHKAPWLRGVMAGTGASTPSSGGAQAIASGSATAGSLPLDPTAVETTIGSGGLPSQHGITGTWIHTEHGGVTRAFGHGAPEPVIATLGDDLDRATGGHALIGLIGDDAGDVGLTGDAWYGTGPVRDRTARTVADPSAAVETFLRRGWGADTTPDLLAVALGPSVRGDDQATAAIVRDVMRSVPTAMVVVTGTGGLDANDVVSPTPPAGTVRIPGGAAAGGYFLDRSAGAAAAASTVVDAMHTETAPDGSPLYADAFASYAVRFGRYC
jgi:hypothetical protein